MKTNQHILLKRFESDIEFDRNRLQKPGIVTLPGCAVARATEAPPVPVHLKVLGPYGSLQTTSAREAGLAHRRSHEVTWRKSRNEPEALTQWSIGTPRIRQLFESVPSSEVHASNVSHAGGGAGMEKIRGISRGEGPYPIREATLDDAPGVAFVHGESLGATPPDDADAPDGPYTAPGWTRELLDARKAVLQSEDGVEKKRREIAQALADPNQLFLIANDEEGTIVGLCLGIRGNEETTIDRIYIRPDHWGRGIGRSLVKAITDWSNPDLPLAVATPPTHPSVLFYQSMGFEVVADSEHQITVGDRDRVWLVRLIRPPQLAT